MSVAYLRKCEKRRWIGGHWMCGDDDLDCSEALLGETASIYECPRFQETEEYLICPDCRKSFLLKDDTPVDGGHHFQHNQYGCPRCNWCGNEQELNDATADYYDGWLEDKNYTETIRKVRGYKLSEETIDALVDLARTIMEEGPEFTPGLEPENQREVA